MDQWIMRKHGQHGIGPATLQSGGAQHRHKLCAQEEFLRPHIVLIAREVRIGDHLTLDAAGKGVVNPQSLRASITFY